MKIKSIIKWSSLAVFVMLLLQSCAEEDSSFGKDLQVPMLPTELSYPEILNAREFVEVESAAPFTNTNGHPVTFKLESIKKGEEILDASYLSHVSIKNYSVIESTVRDANDSLNPYIIFTNDLYEMGKITIAENDQFSNGEYFFTVSASTEINGATQSTVFEDALRLYVGPDLADGIAYCPFNMNFVSGENITSNPAELFGANSDVRYELGSESDKLSINAATGELSLNSSYTVTSTEVVKPIINVVSNITEEVVSFEETFTATLSATPVALDKQNDYFFFPTLKQIAPKNVSLGGDGYSHQVVKYFDPNNTWYNNNAFWRNKQAKQPTTPDAVAIRADAGVPGLKALQVPFWTITAPTNSWIIMDEQNLALYQGCFDSKAVFWYKLKLDPVQAGYEADGSTPIGLEVRISDNYTGDATTTSWTYVNDILECEIEDNGTIFTGTPYPGDQSGMQPPSGSMLPNGVKDLAKNANDLWVRCELNLEDYKSYEKFTLGFKLKTYYDVEPYHQDTNGVNAVNGFLHLANVHFVASEK